jgi:hypothetical protein
MTARRSVLAFLVALTLAGVAVGQARPPHPWLGAPAIDAVETCIEPPAGFHRLSAAAESFAAWLRSLPLKPAGSLVHLYNGALKANQSAQWAVLDLDVGTENLQQCADAVIRLRAEYLFWRRCEEAIAFDFTSGDRCPWLRFKNGERPRIRGRSHVVWEASTRPDGSYTSFRRYLETVFQYAGTASLRRELLALADSRLVEPGDVFIRGGFPGHAVIVLDVAAGESGQRAFLLAQSYMPAQEIHILRNPVKSDSPWYDAAPSGELETPEWTFKYSDLHRFPTVACPP